MKIYCIGAPKTGTSTLHHAFTQAGLACSHGSVNGGHPPLALSLWRAFTAGINPFADIPPTVDVISDCNITGCEKHGGVTLWPAFFPSFLQKVREFNADTWILLNKRNITDWIKSVRRWKSLHSRIVAADLPFLPPGRGSTDSELTLWMEDHYARVEEAFACDSFFLSVEIENPETPRIIENKTGIALPWWGIMNQQAYN